jgi:FKBP-type peptidyl-prolyl cis-trans isomerase FkpA
MKKIIALFSLIVLASCGGDKADSEEQIKLVTEKDKLSYSFGAEQVSQMANDPNFKSMDLKMLEDGFSEGLKYEAATLDPECKDVLQKLFGPYGQDFEVAYAKDGSKCIGKVIGFEFMKFCKSMGGESQIDLEMVKIGFKQGLQKKDTLIKSTERLALINTFISGLNQSSSAKMMEKAKKMSNIKTLSGGILIQTIEEGKGGSPTADDDVEANYILTNAKGDTIESSFAIQKMQGTKEAPKFNLNGVIQGWKQSFPSLKKGGKYRLYVPAELAYGDQKGALCFYIEFINFGKAGTLVKPQSQQPSM